LQRRRIALTRKSGAAAPTAGAAPPAVAAVKPATRGGQKPLNPTAPATSKPAETFRNNPFAAHFKK
ncbi:MAG TPA: hypothetical protein VEQ59_15170, partial [Polyangiaceae bacterium]|nr:hypothetical protein [Polyangiaceae bacterium]